MTNDRDAALDTLLDAATALDRLTQVEGRLDELSSLAVVVACEEMDTDLYGLAIRLGVTASHLRQIFNGKRRLTLQLAAKIQENLDATRRSRLDMQVGQ